MPHRAVGFALVIMLAGPLAGASRAVEAIDLTGSWATDNDNCDKIFVRSGGRMAFSEDSDIYGGGFTVDGDRINAKTARCEITRRTNDGDTMHILAACASDIMYSNIQLSLRVRDKNSITRVFPGMEGIEINYHRCLF